MSMRISVRSRLWMNVTVPVTLLPDFGSSFAVALMISGACANALSAQSIPTEMICIFMRPTYRASELFSWIFFASR